MVKSCCVFKCSNKADSKAKENGISFFRFPQNVRKRRAWANAVNRENWIPNEYTHICSVHFVDAWHSDDPTDSNFVPTIFAYKDATPTPLQQTRNNRVYKRSLAKEFQEAEVKEKATKAARFDTSVLHHAGYCVPLPDCMQPATCEQLFEDDVDFGSKCLTDIGTQCDTDQIVEENKALNRELLEVRKELQQSRWGIHKIKDNDKMTRFYTGLPIYAVFFLAFQIHSYLSPKVNNMTYWTGKTNTAATPTDRKKPLRCMLNPIDQLLSVLMRLKLGLYVQDVADRFGISVGAYSQLFTTWICLLHAELEVLNPFPSRDIIETTKPDVFQKYPRLRVIIDCTEIFVQRSSNLINQNLTFSHYKHHNTLKFLIGITPSGVISFVSEAWGGRVSDVQITQESGILDLLEPGDNVMADKGFTIADLLNKIGCTLNIPPFKGQNKQFSTEDIFKTQEIAELRIHVERSIGRVKNFHIFDGVLPLSLAPIASKMFQVVCWLTNLDVPLVENK